MQSFNPSELSYPAPGIAGESRAGGPEENRGVTTPESGVIDVPSPRLRLGEFEAGGMRIHCRFVGESLEVTVEGAAFGDAEVALFTYFDDVRSEALRLGIQLIDIDLRKTTYVAPSFVEILSHLISYGKPGPDEAHAYWVGMILSGNQLWQLQARPRLQQLGAQIAVVTQ